MIASNDTSSEAIILGKQDMRFQAISELVASLPAELKATHIVVQHPPPHRKSLMTELVGRQARRTVEDIVDGSRPIPNIVCDTPPNQDVVLKQGVLSLINPNPETASPKPSYSIFSRSFMLKVRAAADQTSVQVLRCGENNKTAPIAREIA